MEGYKEVKEVSKYQEIIKFMMENDTNICITESGSKLIWKHYKVYGDENDKQLCWEKEKCLFAIANTQPDKAFKCYKKKEVK